MHTAVTSDSRPASAAGSAESPRKRRWTRRKVGASAGKHIVLIVLSAMFGLPLLWMVLTSFKTAAQALTPATTRSYLPHCRSSGSSSTPLCTRA
jgi:ABC-type maltose transport system permease subunit